MVTLLEHPAVENVVRTGGHPARTRIFSSSGEELASILRGGGSLVLVETGGRTWVMGQSGPFSLAVVEAVPLGKSPMTALRIRENLFGHGGRAYKFTGVASDSDPRDFHLGDRHVYRLDNFPFPDPYEADLETLGRLRRYYRGTVVGELSGLGREGYRLRLSAELADISLALTAASYVLYSSF